MGIQTIWFFELFTINFHQVKAAFELFAIINFEQIYSGMASNWSVKQVMGEKGGNYV